MFVLPLGLGTKLRRLPLVTLAIALLWVGVFVLDHSYENVTFGLFDAAAKSGIRDASRKLFVDYCRSREGVPERCKKYAVLVWTGFPGKGSKVTKKSVGAPADAAMVAEMKSAAVARKELSDCSTSRRCLTYKDIMWTYLNDEQHRAAAFARLPSYQPYQMAVNAYQDGLKRVCLANACLAHNNINLWSLMAAQVRHGGFWHLFWNLAFFLVFGIYVEQRSNRFLYLLITIIGGTVGMAVHTAFFGGSDSIALGGSANVSAVLGMFYAFYFSGRMRLLVWLPRKIYAGSKFFADVRYAFPLLFVLGDVSGGFDHSFTALLTTKVAHFAHLTGMAIGVVSAFLICRWRRLPEPLLFEIEIKDLQDLEACPHMVQTLEMATEMVRCNPENVHALEAACGKFLLWQRQPRPREQGVILERGRAFLGQHMSTVCAVNARRRQEGYACRLLSLMPMYYPFPVYLGRLGQVSTLRIADHAASQGQFVLALRLYDLFLSRFPLSVKCRGVEATALSIIKAMPMTQETLVTLESFLTHHQGSFLAPNLALWLSSLKARPA